jgi:hypothetical protein
MSDKLCPFCGGSECYSVDDYGDVSVACLYKTHGDTWNARPLEDAANARAEAAEARAERLKTALMLILDCADYTSGACGLTEMIGGVLPRQIIDRARDALKGGEE